MTTRFRQIRKWLPLLAIAVTVGAAAQGAFPSSSTFRATDPEGTAIAFSFDTSGTLTTYVNGQQFSSISYKVTGDEVSFREITSPADYSCGDSQGRYKWKLEGNQLVFTLVSDTCDLRSRYLTGLAWTRG